MGDRVEFMLKYGSPDHIRQIVRGYRQHGIDNSGWAIDKAMENSACPSDILDQAIKSENHNIKAKALKHQNLSVETHTKALNGSDPDVREAALLSHHTTEAQLMHHSTKDPDPDVRRIAGNILRNVHG